MSVAYRGAATGLSANTGSSSSVTVPAVPGLQAGDFMVAGVYTNNSAGVTAPAGWTKLRIDSAGDGALSVLTRAATAADLGAATTFPLVTVGGGAAVVVAYSGAAGVDGSSSAVGAPGPAQGTGSGASSVTEPVVTTSRAGEYRVSLVGNFATSPQSVTLPAGSTLRSSVAPPTTFYGPGVFAYDTYQAVAGASTPVTSSWATRYNGYTPWVATLALRDANVAAGAPSLLEPVGNQPVDRLQAQTFRVQPNDPDAGDTLSRLRVRYRPDGTSTWTTISQDGPLTSLTRPAGTFALGKWEWQAETTDAGGLVSTWSASEFFTAGDTPGAPTITGPANNATLTDPSTGQVTWSTTQQDALQVRAVADLAGSPNTAVVLYDSDVQAQAETRAWTVPRPVNGRVEHTQVRVRYLGLWGPWASVRNTVAYIAPAMPNLTLSLDPRGLIACLIAHPTPVGGQPAVAYTELWRRRVGRTSSLRLAEALSAGTYLDARVANRVAYEYQAVAVGVNGSSNESGWTATATNNTQTAAGSLAYGSGAYGEGPYS